MGLMKTICLYIRMLQFFHKRGINVLVMKSICNLARKRIFVNLDYTKTDMALERNGGEDSVLPITEHYIVS